MPNSLQLNIKVKVGISVTDAFPLFNPLILRHWSKINMCSKTDRKQQTESKISKRTNTWKHEDSNQVEKFLIYRVNLLDTKLFSSQRCNTHMSKPGEKSLLVWCYEPTTVLSSTFFFISNCLNMPHGEVSGFMIFLNFNTRFGAFCDAFQRWTIMLQFRNWS